jgi:hypothetical protein
LRPWATTALRPRLAPKRPAVSIDGSSSNDEAFVL